MPQPTADGVPETDVIAADAPEWFRRALEVPVEVDTLVVDGATIACRRWGGRDKPPLVLVHGGGANSRWWDHVAPQLTAACSVVALDLSGHGDSDHRASYSFATWANEILTVAEQAGDGQPAVVVAHSMGGLATVQAAASSGDRLKGIVIIDSPITQISPEEQAGRLSAFGPKRVYPSVAAALERFHPVPDQPSSLSYVIDHVARTSLLEVPDGWMWKFDPGFTDRGARPLPETLSRVIAPFALLRAQFGLVTADMGRDMVAQSQGPSLVVEVPQAYHHVMLDQPLALVTAVRTILAAWDYGER